MQPNRLCNVHTSMPANAIDCNGPKPASPLCVRREYILRSASRSLSNFARKAAPRWTHGESSDCAAPVPIAGGHAPSAPGLTHICAETDQPTSAPAWELATSARWAHHIFAPDSTSVHERGVREARVGELTARVLDGTGWLLPPRWCLAQIPAPPLQSNSATRAPAAGLPDSEACIQRTRLGGTGSVWVRR